MSRLSGSRSRRPNARGWVLFPVVLLLMAMGMLTMILVDTAASVSRRVTVKADEERLAAAGDAAMDLAVGELWKDYLAARGGTPGPLSSVKTFLDGKAIAKHTGPSGTLGKQTVYGAPWSSLVDEALLPLDANTDPTFGDARVTALDVAREDGATTTVLRLRTEVSFGAAADSPRREVERLYFVAGEEFKGLGFGLLANNVNCIMCHARFDSTDRFFNRDPSKYGTFDRIRVGTLEALKIRTGSADSVIAGTLYSRGAILKKDGTPLVTFPGTTFDSALFDGAGKLFQDGAGNLTPTPFVPATGSPLPSLANLYRDYPIVESAQTDGIVPTYFPSVIPDTNGNRVVDAAEFAAITSAATGTLTDGIKVHVPTGSTHSGSGLPLFDGTGPLQGAISGNLVLIGTSTNPLQLDGRIAVDGDVVLGGVVKGAGEIIASGNVYVVGPLMYADGTDADGYRTFGVGPTGNPNRLTLGAGGNILIGDFLTKKAGGLINGTPDGGFNFTLSETTLFNQMEWTKTQPTLPGAGGTTVTNPLYDPDHVPRYYVIDPGDPVAIFNKGTTWFDPVTKSWMGSELTTSWSGANLTIYPAGSPQLAGAGIVPLTPPGAWLDPEQLFSMWQGMNSAYGGGPMQLDGLFYTNNATILLTRSAGAYGGRVTLNGGLVGADMGILVPGNGGVGLQLNYDRRHQGVLDLDNTNQVRLTRGFRVR